MIQFDEKRKVFHLYNNEISYLMEIVENDYLTHLYFGKRVNGYSGLYQYPRRGRSFSPNPPGWKDQIFSLDIVMMEYPGHGFGDFREPAYDIKLADGSRVVDFRFKSYNIIKGKKALEGLPATYVNQEEEAWTLELILEDSISKLGLQLNYTIFEGYNAICRSAKIVNLGHQVVELNRFGSTSIDFPVREMELIHLNGSHSRERQITREEITTGIKRVDSKRGTSSHHQNPFVALVEKTTTEEQGEAYGFCLLYSGNHETVIQKDPFDQTRVVMGINSFNFAWQLKPGESFQAPEVAMAYSDKGLNQMSHTYHSLFNHNLVRGKFKLQERPILINNWEATYFSFDEDKIMEIVEEGSKLGIELFVLDDGWFGSRENEDSSLGDWFENEGKLKNGLLGLAEKVHAKGMKFGLWFEPEMVSENSELFRKHPDWAIGIPGRERSLGRNQYVLDFSRTDVRENIYNQMKLILDQVPIDYIKWDMNRHITEAYSLMLTPDAQGEFFHRYILGLYEFMEKLTQVYPDILFESCSGGGGRFDAGFLYYMPQAWTSDNTDAVARLKIQYGSSLSYPISSMGAHVSAVPNHQIRRATDMEIRGNVAMSGVFGYELDLTKLSEEEKQIIKKQVAFYKKHRQLLQFGTFIRLLSPFEGNDVAWMFVSEDQREAIVFCFRVLSEAAYPFVTLKLEGLSSSMHYELVDSYLATKSELPVGIVGGDELMNIGIYIEPIRTGDFVTKFWHLKAV